MGGEDTAQPSRLPWSGIMLAVLVRRFPRLGTARGCGVAEPAPPPPEASNPFRRRVAGGGGGFPAHARRGVPCMLQMSGRWRADVRHVTEWGACSSYFGQGSVPRGRPSGGGTRRV